MEKYFCRKKKLITYFFYFIFCTDSYCFMVFKQCKCLWQFACITFQWKNNVKKTLRWRYICKCPFRDSNKGRGFLKIMTYLTSLETINVHIIYIYIYKEENEYLGMNIWGHISVFKLLIKIIKLLNVYSFEVCVATTPPSSPSQLANHLKDFSHKTIYFVIHFLKG